MAIDGLLQVDATILENGGINPLATDLCRRFSGERLPSSAP